MTASLATGPSRALRARIDRRDVVETIWLTRPDLRALAGGDRTRFEFWLAINGSREYRALSEDGFEVSPDSLAEPDPRADASVRPVLTRFMREVCEARPDLSAAFDLSTSDGQAGFVWWFFIQGPSEFDLTRYFTPEQRLILSEPVPEFAGDGFVPVTRFMAEVWRRRPDLQEAFDLRERQGRQGFFQWYFGPGVHELPVVALIDETQARALRQPLPGGGGVSLAEALVWQSEPAVRERFPSLSDPALPGWLRGAGRDDHPLLVRVLDGEAREAVPAPVVIGRSPGMDAGVNLIGYAKGQLGIGEDVRMAALAMRSAGIPFSIYNVEPGREVCQGDTSAVDDIADELRYRTSIFCMTGIETAKLAAVEGGRLFDGRFNIGLWPWEFARWPDPWAHAYSLVDEVWAASRFTQSAYASSSPVPVAHMPMAVSVEATAGLARRDFGLPEGRFLFVFSFDFLSSLARKNPLGCLRAFRAAFPTGSEPVGLVIKVMRAPQQDARWQAFLDEVSADPRITVIERTLDRGEVLDLYRATDCFVSLHRSEGFGRGIAEAMALGRSVIATGYSGNMDFTSEETAALVEFEMCEVGEDEYAFGAGLQWAHPSVDHAAWCMRKMASDAEYRRRQAGAARQVVTGAYSPEAVGRRYSGLGFLDS